jgi:hypothetical protein
MSHSHGERMSDRLLGKRGGLIITVPAVEEDVGSYQNLRSSRAWFFRVSRWQRLNYDPYDQLGALNQGQTVGFDYLGDGGVGAGNDIFRIRRDDFHVYHFGIGVNSPDLRVYYSVDPQTGGNRAFEYPSSVQDVVPGDDRSYYDGRSNGNVFDPPAHTERVAIRNDRQGELLQFGFEATANLSANATVLNIEGRGYKLQPVTDEAVQDAMLKQATAPPKVSGTYVDYPVSMVQMGGLQTWTLGTETPEDWDDEFRRDLTFDGTPEAV